MLDGMVAQKLSIQCLTLTSELNLKTFIYLHRPNSNAITLGVLYIRAIEKERFIDIWGDLLILLLYARCLAGT